MNRAVGQERLYARSHISKSERAEDFPEHPEHCN